MDYKKRCGDCACLINKNGVWCCDECFGQACADIDECPEGISEEEQNELDNKAKSVKIDHGAKADEPQKKTQKERTVKVSDRKKHLFSNLKTFLSGYASINDGLMVVEKENKLILLEIDGKTFKIDLIECRKPKN